MKLIDVKDNTYTDFKKEVNDKDPKFMTEFPNKKAFSLKDTHQIGLKKFCN